MITTEMFRMSSDICALMHADIDGDRDDDSDVEDDDDDNIDDNDDWQMLLVENILSCS